MLSSKFINFMKALNSGKTDSLTCVVDLGRVGLRMAEEYSTRFDLLEVEQCLYLSEFQTPKLEKAEKHLLNLVKKNDPLFSLMEYYDNYPYAYSDINYLFKGCLKSGVEISIKAVNPMAKNSYFKKLHKLGQSLKLHNFFMPWLNRKYKVEEILKDLEQHSLSKFDLKTEIKNTRDMTECIREYPDIKFLNRVRFPKIYSYLSSEDMVVNEFIYGSYFYELLTYKKLAYKDVIDLIKIQLFFMLKLGKFHNNLHSGNLILSDEGYIYFLDCNNISQIDENLKMGIFKILKATSKRDFPSIATYLNEISKNKIDRESLEKLTKDIEHIFSTNTIKDNTLIKKLMQVFKVSQRYNIVFDNSIYPIFKSFIYLNKLVEITKNKNIQFSEDLGKILSELEPLL